jgi:hypothetical protein
MMVDLEGSVVLAPINGSDCAVSESAPEETVSSGTSHEIPETQIQTKSEPPNSPLSLTLLSDQCETAPLPSNSRKLNLEFVAVRLPTPILEPSKDAPQLQDALLHEQDVSDKPEVAIRVSISTPPSTSIASNVIDTPISLPLEEPAVCSDVVMRSIEQGCTEAHNMLSSAGEMTEVVKLAASPLTILTDKSISPKMPCITSTVPCSKKLLLLETTNKRNNTRLVQKGSNAMKSPRRKPVVVNTENPLTNYFKPVSITLTADDDEIETSKKGGARTIHLSIDTSDKNENIATPIAEPDVYLQSSETAHNPQQTISKHAEVPEDSQVPSLSSAEILTPTKENSTECEVSDWRDVLSPVKVVVEKVEDFILTKTFSALETTPPLNVEHDKELPLQEVSSSSRRKTKSPLKRHPGNPKQPPFKSEKTKEHCVEAMSKDKLSKSSSRLSKSKAKEGMKPLKRSSRSRNGRTMEVTASEAIPGQKTASAENTSPSLLSVVSGRMSRSKTNQIKPGNTSSKVAENDPAVPQKSEFLELSTAENHCKPVLHSHAISDGVKAKRRNSSKSRKRSSIKDLNECGQAKIDENNSLLVCSKEKALGVQINKQNDDSSKTNVREVSGNAYEGGEPLDSASVEAVDVELFKSSSEAQADGVTLSEQNISDSYDALEVSTGKLEVTDAEVSKQGSTDAVEQVYDEIPLSGVKVSEPSTSDNSDCIEVGMQNGTVPHLGTSAGTGTSEEEVYSMKKGCSNTVEPTTEGLTSRTSSNSLIYSVNADKKVAKSAFSKMNNPHIEETSKLEVEDGKQVSYSDGNPEPTVRTRKSKLKSFLVSLGSGREETSQDKPVDILDSQMDVLPHSGGLGAERNEPHVTGVRRGERKRTSGRHIRSLSPTENVCTKSKKRQLCGMGFGNDVEKVQISSRRSRSSPLRQSSLDSRVTEVRNPETCVSSAVTSIAEDGTTFNVTETTSVLTSTEAPTVTVPISAAVVTADPTGEISILPTSVEEEMEPVQLCDDHTVREGISEKLTASVSSFCKEKNSPVEKVVLRQKTRCSVVKKETPVLGVMPHRLRSSASKLNENIKDTVSLYATSPKMPLGTHVSEVKENKRVIMKSQMPDCLILLDGLKPSLEPEETISCVPESEITLSSVEIPSRSTGPEGAQADSQEVADSQDVIESSQDSSTSSTSIVSRFPSVHNCSVSVRRINTSLEAGAKIDISQGDQKLMVFMPPDSSSPFKVYSPGKRTLRAIEEEKSEKTAGEMESCHRSKLLSATRSLYGKSGAANPSRSVQDKPDVPRDESVQGPVCKVIVSRSAQNVPTTRNGIPKQRYKTRKCGDSILNIAKAGAAKPKSTKSVGIITVKECVPTVTADGAPRARSRRQASTRKPEVSFAVINVGGPPKLRQRKSNTLKHVDVPPVTDITSCILKDSIKKHGTREEIALVTVDSIPVSGKQVDKSKPVDSKEQSDLSRTGENISAAVTDVTPESRRKVSEIDVSKEDASEHHSGLLSGGGKEGATKPQSSISICEDVSAVSNENTSELQLKKQTDIPRSEGDISSVWKQDALKPQFQQQINASVSEVSVSVVSSEGASESCSKEQINVSKSEDNVSTVCQEDASKLQSGQQINVSECDDSALRFLAEDTSKQQQIDTSVSVDSVSTVNAEDIPELRFRLQINASECGDDILEVGKKGNLKSQSKHQVNTSGSKDNILSADKEDTQKPQSKQEINTPSSENGILMSVVEDSLKSKPKQSINASERDSVLMPIKEGVSKPQLKRKKCEDHVSTAVKEDTLKPGVEQVISLTNITECKLKHHVQPDTPKPQPNILKAEDKHVSVVGNDASEPELNCRVHEENFTVSVIEDAVDLRLDQKCTNDKMNLESEIEDVDILGTKVVLRLGSEKVVSREEPVKDKTQHSVKPKRVSTNYRRGGRTKKTKEKNEPKLDHKTSSTDDSSLTLQKIAHESHCTDNASDVAETFELKETGILQGDSQLSLPLQSCKRLADSNPTLLEFHQGKADSSQNDHIGTGGSKIRRLSQNAESVHTKPACDCSPTSSPSRVKLCSDRDIDRTPSPPSRSMRSSPSSFLQALSSPVRSVEFQNHRNRHRPSSGGRAQYMVGLAVAAKDTETTQASSPVPPQKPEEAISIIAAASPSSPLSRKKLTYDMSNGSAESGALSLERQVLFAYVDSEGF